MFHTRVLGHSYPEFDMVHELFDGECVYVVYNVNFNMVHHQQYWPICVGPKVIPDLTMRRAKKGRPPVTRIRTEIDNEEYTRR